MPGTDPEDVARAFRVAGDAIDLRKLSAKLAVICDADIQSHITDAALKYPPPPKWARVLSRPKGSQAPSITGNAPLVFSGQLRRSFSPNGQNHVQRVSIDEFTYGSNLHYARVQDEGGKALFKVSQDALKAAKGARHVAKHASGLRYVRMQLDDGSWIMKRVILGGFPINIRSRPYCYLSVTAQNKVADELGVKIERDFERA